MSKETHGIASSVQRSGFRAALAFYPACGLRGRFDPQPFLPYAPVLVLHGSADEEVSADRCVALVARSRQVGGQVEMRIYHGATHGFDSPARTRQQLEANATATADAMLASVEFFQRHLAGTGR